MYTFADVESGEPSAQKPSTEKRISDRWVRRTIDRRRRRRSSCCCLHFLRTGWAERRGNAAAANICPRSRRRTRREWSQRPPFTECPTMRGTAQCSRGVPLVTEIHPKPLNCKSTPNTAGAHAGLLLDRVPHVEEFPPGNLLRRRPQKFQLGKNRREEDDTKEQSREVRGTGG